MFSLRPLLFAGCTDSNNDGSDAQCKTCTTDGSAVTCNDCVDGYGHYDGACYGKNQRSHCYL